MRSFFDLSQWGSCVLCRQPAPLDAGLCDACRTVLPGLPEALCRCGLPCPASVPQEPAPLCGRCLARPPEFERVCCALAYDFPLDQLVNRYKHRRQLSAERALGRLWRAALPFPGPLPDALVPVPSPWHRLWRRGFNPAWRLARIAADTLGCPLLPALHRARATPRQQGLTARLRAFNLQGALSVRRPVAGLSLAVIDDVITTGSTAREASRCLLAAGAARVEVWALARTLPRWPG